jgi:hypothetical protein
MYVKHVYGQALPFEELLNEAILEILSKNQGELGSPACILNISYIVDHSHIHAFIEWDYAYEDEDFD